MNKGRYRLVFSDEKGGYVPVPEETAARGKGTGGRALRRLVAAMAAALPGLAIANPTGHQVIQGQVGVQQQGSTLNITASDKSIIHWKQFSIQPGETTRFIQPGSTSTVLNRVVGQDPSQILGNLVANGRVFLINPNGVLFGAGAKVDTAGLVASTLNIKNEDFTAGRLKFDAEGGAGKLRNEGTLRTTGGPLLLIATDVENTGIVTAENGDVVLAAGKSVEIADPHQPSLRVRIEAGGEAINLGQLIARNGSAGMFGAAITQSGKVAATGAQRTADGRIVLRGSKSVTLGTGSETFARSDDGTGGTVDIAAPSVKVEAGAVVDASGTTGGRIEIAARDLAAVDGSLRATGTVAPAAPPAPSPTDTSAPDLELPVTASGPAPATTTTQTDASGHGGHIEVTADTVVVGGTATLDASGDSGGGSVLVGGDWQGANPDVPNALVTRVDSGARLLADALVEGDGGKVVVWADQATAFHGNIWARGGSGGGNGGHVEVSGKVALLYRGRTDTSAARGKNGTLLLDPLAIVIQGGSGDGSNDGSAAFNGGTPGSIDAGALGPTVIYESEIEEQSKTTDIILRAQRSVTVGNSAFSYTGSGNADGETAGQLTLATGSSLLIETRNLGGEEGGPSAGIDLVTGGAHGASLRIVAQGDGGITMQTGYSNGVATGDQRADIIVPVLTAGEGNILLRTVRGTGSTLQFRNAVTTGGTLQTSADTHTGSQHLQGDAGVSIDGDYIVDSGTLDIDGASAAISGTLFLSGTLDGNAPLTLGGLVWYSGVITGTGAVTLTGNGELPQNYSYHYLDRQLVVAGTLDLKNNYQLYVRNGGKLHLGATGTLRSSTHDGNIYLTAGASGTATFSADAGARIEIAAGRRINLYSDGNGGNQFSSRFELSGDGTLALNSGNFTLTGDSVIAGSGNLALDGADLGGSGNLDIGSNVVWTAGRMYGSGTTTFSGQASLPQATNNKVLQRRLDITGTLDLDNNYWLYVQNGGMLHVGSTGTVRTSGNDGNIYFNAGASGVANFGADDGARFEVAAGRTLRLFSDGNAGNRFSAVFELGGAGTLALTGGSFTLQGDSSITGSGTLALSGGDLTGSGNLDIGSKVVWTAGGMSGTGTTTFSGLASLPQATSNKTLQRRLDITGTLDLDNNYWLYVQNGGTLHVSSTGTVRTTGNDAYIYLNAGASGVASFSTDDGATIEVAGDRTLRLFSDGSAGNRFSAAFELGGAGTLALSSGNFTLLGDSSVTGTGTLALSGADLSGSGNLDIASAVIWSAGRMSGTGTTTFSGAASLPQVNSYKFLQRRLDITGTLDLNNNYALYIQNGGTLHVASSGVLRTTTGDSNLYFDAGASGVTSFSADEGARIEVAAERTLRLYSDGQAGNQFSAHLDVTGEGMLSLNGGRFTLDGDSVIGGSGNYLLNLDLGGSGNITLRDNFTWSGGNMSGSGRTVLDTSVTLSGTRYIDRELVIAEDRTLLLNDNAVLRSSDATNGGGRVTAVGTLAKGSGSGNAYLQYLDITGNIESRGGLLRLYGYSAGQGSSMGGVLVSSLDAGGVLIESGSFHVTGSSLQIAADSALNFNAGTLNLNGGSVTGTGDFRMNGGTLNANQDSAIGSRFTLSGGTLTGNADLTLSGGFEWAGGTMSGTGRTVLASGTAGTISNASAYKFLHRRLDVAGTLNFANSNNYDLYIRDGGTLHISSTGTLTTTSNSYIYLNEGYNGSGNGIAALSSEAGGRIAVADGTTLFINGDNADGNRLRGNVELSGPGAVQINSGLITVDAATSLTGDGPLRLNGGTLATDAATSIARLQITGGTLSGTATVTLGDLLWQSGTISGSGTAVLAGSGTLDSTSAYKYLHRRLVVDGTLTLANSTNYDLYIRDGGTLHIGATGTLATSTNGYIYFNEGYNGSNNGIAALTSAAGGRIAVADGSTLFLTADSSATNLISGSFALAGPGALQINSGLITVDRSSAFTGAGLLRLNGGTLYAGAATSIANLDLSGGTLDGPATVTLDKLLWRSGSMAGSGTTVLSGTGTIDNTSAYRYLLRRLDVAGTLNIVNSGNYDLQIRDGGTLNIASTGTLAASTNAYIYLNEGYNGSGNGQARLSAATGGRIAVASGSTLFINADGSANNLLSGNFLLDGPGVVQLNSGALATDLATQLAGPGVFRLAGGSLTAGAALGIGNLELNGSALTGSGDITVFDRFVWNSGSVAGSGVLTLAGNSTLASNTSYKDASREVRVSGNLTVTDQNGYGMRLNNARLAVLAGGTLTLENDARITHTGTGRLDNAGLLVKRGPSALTLAMPLTNTGTLRVEESTLSATAFPINDGQIVLVGGATLSTAANLTNNGSIAGRGTISVGAGTLTNAGLLQPGGDGAAGLLAIQGNLIQTSTGALEAELLGSTLAQQDLVQVSGTIALGGNLEITPGEGVTLGAGNRYTVLSCSTLDCLSGVFDTVDLNGLTATQNYFSNALSFANGTLASTWISTTSGFWDVAANWAGGLLPTSTTDVVIDQAGDLTITVRSTGSPFVIKSLYSNENISITGGSLTLNEDSVINGRLSMSGGTLTVGSGLELGALSMSGGTITGGRLIAAAGTYAMSGGTLNALEMQLGLRLSVTGTSYMQNVTLSRLGSNSDAGLVQVGNGSTLEARGTLTLDGATIRLASTSTWTYLRANSSVAGTVLNIAGNGTIDFAGSNNYNVLTASRGDNTLNVGAGITLTGTQSGEINMGSGGTFSGTALATTAGETLEFSGSNWTNTGTLRAAGGNISLTSSGSTTWSSTGSLDLDSGTLTLGGNFNTASFNTLDRDGVAAGTLYITGALNNTGATLLFDDSTGAALLSGSITGGTVRANNPAGGALRMNGTGYLIDTTLAGVDGVEGSGLFVIDNGQIMEARGTLTLDGATIRLASTSTWTYLRANSSVAGTVLNIAGNGTIDFAGSNNYNVLTASRGDNTLNVGAGITLTGTQSGEINMGSGGTFSGTALATTAGETLEFSGSNWTNTGTLRAAGGNISLTSSGSTTWSSTGSLDLDSGTLTLGGNFNTASFNTLDRDGVAAGTLYITGALNNTGATLLFDDSTGAALLSGSITGGTVRANNPAGGALRMNGTGYLIDTTLAGVDGVEGSGLFVIDNGQIMEARGTLTLDGATIRLASTSTWTYLRANSSVAGTVLNIAGNGTIDFAGSNNYNVLTASRGDNTLNVGAGITLTGTQSGEINMGSGGTFSGTALATTAGETFEFNSNGGWTNAGTLRLEGGAIASTTSFTNSGTIRGYGSLNAGSNTVTNTGLLRPDGLLVLTGNLVLGGAGTLEVGIAGTERGAQYDALDVSGTVTFGGTLRALHEAGFTPGTNAGLRVVRYNARMAGSTFASLDVPAGFGYGSYYGAANYVLGTGSGLTGINEWINNSSGNWSVGSNWSLGAAPNSADQTVLIDRVGYTPTVTISAGAWTIGSLSSEEALSITGGSLTVNGATRIGSTLSVSGGRFEALGALDLNTVSVGGSASQFIAHGGGRIASFDQTNGTSTFNSAGLSFLVLTPRGGTVNFNAAVGLPSSTLRVASYVANINADLGLATLDVDSGTVNLNVANSSADIDLSGGTLNVAGSTAMSGDLTWTGGTIAGGGVLALSGVLNQSGNTTVYLRETTLDHSNTSGDSRIANTSSSGFNIENGGVLRNSGALTLSVEAPAGILYIDQDSGAAGRFENTGTLVKTGAGRADIGNYGSMTFVQNGVLNVEGGSLTLGNTVSLAGTQTVANGALLQVMSGTTTLGAGRSITGAGALLQSGGTLVLGDSTRIATAHTMTGGTLTVNAGVSADMDARFTWSAGTINGGGLIDLNGAFDQTGNTTVFLNATTLQHHDSSGDSRIANTSSSGFNLENGAVFRNTGTLALISESPTGNLYIDHDSGSASRFVNTGTLTKRGAGNVDFGSYGSVAFDQLGTFVVDEGTATLNNAVLLDGTQQLADGALLQVSGGTTTLAAGRRIEGAGSFRLNSGTLALGNGSGIASGFTQAGGTVLIAPNVNAQISGRYDWAAGTISGGDTVVDGALVRGGTLTVSGELQQVGTSSVALDNATLVHSNTSGNSTVGSNSSRNLLLNRGAVFSNASGAVLTLATPTAGNTLYIYQSTGAGSRFENLGTLVKTGAGTLDLGYNGTLAFAQSGVLQVNEGTLLTNAVATYSGTQQIAAGALLRQDSAAGTLSAGASIAGFGTLQVNGGTLTLGDGSTIASDLILTGSGNLNVAGGTTADIDGDIDWSAGNITGTGTLMFNGVLTQAGTGTVNITGTRVIHTNGSGDSRIGNNNGRSFILNSGALFRNAEGAALTLDAADNAGTLYIYQSSGSGSLFENLGTLGKTGSGTVDMGYNGGLQFLQGGSLTVQQGAMALNSVATLTGVQQIAAGATLNVRGGATTLASARAIEGGGTLSLTGGTLTLADSASIASMLSQSGGTLQGSGTNLVSGRYDWTGGTVAGSGTLEVSGALQISSGNSQILDGRTLLHTNASGSSRIYKTSGALYLNNGAVFRNAAGARLLLDSGGGGFNVYSNTTGTLLNEGTLTKVGSGAMYLASNVSFNQPGTLTLGQGTLSVGNAFLNSGTMNLLSGAVFANSSGNTTNQGIVSGFGTLALGSRTFTNSGIVRPGGSGETGTLSITGNFVQDAAGALQIERGNSGTDVLSVTGTATLGGALVVTQLAGYAPATLQTNIVTAGSLGGGFASQTLPSGYSTLAVGNNLVLSYAGAICGGVCWDGGAGTLLWTDAANWTTDLLPGATDLVFIDLAGGVNVQLNSGTHTIASLTTTTGNTLTVSGGSLTFGGGTSGLAASTLDGDLVINGGSVSANAQTRIGRLLMSAGSFGGSSTVRFVGAGSTWTGGDIGGSGTSILEAGATFDYAAGTRSSARRVELRQGATFRHQSGTLTLTGGASNAGVVDVATGATARYGGTASYLLDSTGQYDGGGRVEFIDSAVVTSSSIAAPIADSTFTVRVQDSARFTMSTATSIANLELADNAQVTAQAGFQSLHVTQTGGTLTLNAASQLGGYDWNGGTFAGTGTTTLYGASTWTRGLLLGRLQVASGTTFTISGTGDDDVAGGVYKQFGAGSLTNDGTVLWQSGNIIVMGNGSVLNRGVFDMAGDFHFGDLWVGDGTIAFTNAATGQLVKSAGSGSSVLGSLGLSGGTPNYFTLVNDGQIDVRSGQLRVNVGFNGAPAGGTFTHNGGLDIGAGSVFEVGGSFTHNGHTYIDSGATLRRIGGLTIASGGLIEGFGTIDVGAGNTLRNDGRLQVGDLYAGVRTQGTMQIIGNFVQGSGGTLAMAVGGDAAGEYDRLLVTGTATLGGTLDVSEAPGYLRDSFDADIITAGGGISGSFATVTLPDSGYSTTQGASALRLNFNALVCGGICWDGGAGTNLWTDAANWTGDVLPGLNDLVFISLSGGANVLLNSGSHSIGSLYTGAGNALTLTNSTLTLTGSGSALHGSFNLAGNARLVQTGTHHLDIHGALNWTGTSTFAGGTLNLLAGSNAIIDARTSGGHLILDGLTVNNAGTVDYSTGAYQLMLNNGSVFNNSGRFNFATDGNISENAGFGGNFNNTGTVAKTGGSGTSGFASFARFNNLDGGTLQASGAGALLLQTEGRHDGAFNVIGNNVRIAGSIQHFADGATVHGTLNLVGGTVDIADGGALNIADMLNWTGTSTFAGGTLNLLAGSNAIIDARTSGGHLILDGLTVNNAGTVDYSAGAYQLMLNNGSVFNNSGRFNFATDGNVSENAGFGGNFNNTGTVAKTGGSGTSGFASFARFNNLDGGTLQASGAGALLLQTEGRHDGAFNVIGNNVRIAGSIQHFADGATVHGTLNLVGGTVDIADGGALNIADMLNWTGTSTFAGGTLNLLAGSNAIIDARTSGGHLILDGLTVNNAGTVDYSAGAYQLMLNNGSVFNNSGRFNFATDGNISENAGFGGNFNNTGTVAKTGGSGASGFASFARFNNLDGGTLQASGAGALLLQTEGRHDGAFNVIGNNVRIAGSTQHFADGATVHGTLNLVGGTVDIADDGALNIADTLNWTGTSTITGGTLNLLAGSNARIDARTSGGHLILDGLTVNNAGTVDYSAGAYQLMLNNGSVFNNSGRFNFATDGNINENAGGGGRFNNSGTLAKTGGSGSSGFVTLVRLADAGGSYRADVGTLNVSALSALSGRMDIAAGARIVASASGLTNSGIIAGSGTLDLGGSVLTNRGVLQPGGAGSVGTFSVVGALTQDATGRIEVDFSGTAAGQYDVVATTGSTLLDGVIAIQALGSAQPAEGMQLEVVRSGGALSVGTLQLNAPVSGYTTQASGGALRIGFTRCTVGICWDGGAGTSNWLDAANWTGDVLPGLNDLVFINLAGGADVMLNAVPSVTVGGLTIGNGNALTLTGGVLNAPTTVLGGGTLTLDGGTLDFGSGLTNAGTVTLSGGALTGTQLDNSGLFAVTSAASRTDIDRFINTGTVRVDVDGVFTLGQDGQSFANNGTVDIAGGSTLVIAADDTDGTGAQGDTGQYLVAGGGTLVFEDAVRDFNGGSRITGAGDVTFDGGDYDINGVYSVGGTTRVSSNTLVSFNNTASLGSLDLAGTVDGNGTLNIANDLNWTGGTIAGAGRNVNVGGDTTMDGSGLSLAGARLNITGDGLVDAGTSLALSGGAQVIVGTGSTLGIGSGASIGGSGSLVNRGTLEGTLGGGSSDIGVLLSNSGTVSAASGSLGLTGGIASGSSGSFVIGSGASMELGGELPANIFDLISGAGTLNFSATSQPVINRNFAVQGGTPFLFSVRTGAQLSTAPGQGTLTGEAAGWLYTPRTGFSGNDSAVFLLSGGSGAVRFNVNFSVTAPSVITTPVVQEVTVPLLPEVFRPPRIDPPGAPQIQPVPTLSVASVEALSEIATASGPQFEQPLRDFRASRLQCR